MTDTDTFTISLTLEQLYVLAGAMQLHGLVGFEDPFLGLLAEEADEAVGTALHDLAEQGLVQLEGDGALTVDVGVGACVQATAGAERTIIFSHQLMTRPPTISLVHVAGQVLLEQRNALDGRVILTVLRDANVLDARLDDLVAMPDAPKAPGNAILVTQPELDLSKRIIEERGAEASAVFWREKGLAPAVAQALAEATHQGTLAVLRRSATRADYGASLTWLAGPRGAWRMEPLEDNDPPSARLAPEASVAIGSEIKRIVRQQVPKED